MFAENFRLGLAALLVGTAATSEIASVHAGGSPSLVGDGVVKVRSAYPIGETIDRLQADIRAKGIVFFSALDQAELASRAGVKLRPSTLLTFGNPALGTQFLTSNPAAGLDWPVRLLVVEDDHGRVWAEYTDFAWIAQRHHIVNRDAAFQMASKVIASITAAVQVKNP
jgi:uncharacterized protein (DUF302 family)